MKCAGVSETQRLARLAGKVRRVWLATLLRVVIPLLCVAAWSGDAHAYAWMIRHGYAQCNTCHTDPNGGETLSHMGRVESQTLLSQPWGDNKVTDSSKFLFGIAEPDSVRLGGSLRGMMIKPIEPAGDLKKFPMQMDVYGTADFGKIQAGLSVGYANFREGANPNIMRAAQVFNKDLGPNMVTRWYWLGLELSDKMLLRLGRLNLPFGLRTSEHTLLTRQATATDRESDQQHGLALSYAGPTLRGELMLVAGNYQIRPDAFRERGYAGYMEYVVRPNLALGVNSEVLFSAWDNQDHYKTAASRMAHGLTARYVPILPIVALAEFDVLKYSRHITGYTGFLTLDWEIMQGLHAAGTLEGVDRGREPDKSPSVGFGRLQKGYWLTLNWFFFTHFDLRVDGVFQDTGAEKLSKQLLAQVHFYL